MAGEKLTKDNPSIANLNDKHRPTKLAEMYCELYDNEWTDGLECLLESGYSDEEGIDTLYKTLLVSRFSSFNLVYSLALLQSTPPPTHTQNNNKKKY